MTADERDAQTRVVNNRILRLKIGQVAILWDPSHTHYVVIERLRGRVGILYFNADPGREHPDMTLDGFSWPCMVTLTEDESAALIMQQALAPGSIHDACAAKVAACKEDLQ